MITELDLLMRAVASRTRLRLMALLSQASAVPGIPTGCRPKELARRLGLSGPAVSQHLRVLKDAGLVMLRTEGTRNIYQIRPDGVAALREYLDSLWQSALDQFKATAEGSTPPRKEKLR